VEVTLARLGPLSNRKNPTWVGVSCQEGVAIWRFGGERHRLGVEIVLGVDRTYVLLDEPFTGVEPLLIDTISREIEAAAARGTGILVTDHYHQYVTPLVDTAFAMWQKQCSRLDEDEPIPKLLEELGYL